MSQEVAAADAAARVVPTKSRRRGRLRVVIAFACLIVWLVLTGFDPAHAGKSQGIVALLSDAPHWGLLLAVLFLLVLAAVFRWGDLGLNRPVSWRSLGLAWLPGVYLLLIYGADAAKGLPAPSVIGFLLFNTILAASSEELMFRGVLFGALRARLRAWPAIIITTLTFGAVHLLNLAVIGNPWTTVTQAVAATMSGLVFLALRVRTQSLWPSLVLHALWDFGVLLLGARLLASPGTAAAAAAGSGAGPSPAAILAAIGLLTPNFLYALFLLRKAGHAGAEA